MRTWEPETIQLEDISKPYDVGIVLGGYSNFYIEPNEDRYNFNERGNRFHQALSLYYEGKVKKLIFTGGSGRIISDEPLEAEELVAYLKSIGIPDSVYIVEPNSRTTYENAILTQPILEEQFPEQSYLLITSAFHIPRGYAIFKKLGVECTPYAVDYIGERVRFVPESFLIPDRMGFYHWDVLIREWAAYLGYWLKGYL